MGSVLKPIVGHVGSELVRSNGGVAATIRSFKEALQGFVVSMTSPARYRPEDFFPDYHYIRSPAFAFGYCLPFGAELARARALLSDVHLLTCHNLYRGHVHFVDNCFRKQGTPYWVVPHGVLDAYVYETNYLAKRYWMAVIGYRFLRNASVIIYSTTREKEKAEALHGLRNGVVVYWPVDLPDESLFAHKHEARCWLKQKFNIPNDRRLLLSIGRLHSVKRLTYLIDQFRACDRFRNRAHLVIAGPDADMTCAKLGAYAAGLPVTCIGPVYGNDKSRVLAAVDGYISASAKENFNNTAAEAMAMRLPVILSPGNDIGYEVAGIECGWVLQSDGPAALQNAIHEFSTVPESVLRQRGCAAFSWARSNLAKDRFVETITRLRDETARSVKQ